MKAGQVSLARPSTHDALPYLPPLGGSGGGFASFRATAAPSVQSRIAGALSTSRITPVATTGINGFPSLIVLTHVFAQLIVARILFVEETLQLG